MRQLNPSVRVRLLLAAALLLVCVGLGAGLASARYQTAVGRTAAVEAGPLRRPELEMWKNNDGDVWFPTESGDGYWAEFSVHNASTEELKVELYLLTSDNFDFSHAAVTFSEMKYNDEDLYPKEAAASVFTIPENSPMYRSFGPGKLFEAYYSDNTPVIWTIPGKTSGTASKTGITGTVTITCQEGFDPETVLLYLGASAVS